MGNYVFIAIGLILILLIAVYFLTRKKSYQKNYRAIIAMLHDRIFPGGEDQQAIGGKALEKLLGNKLSKSDAIDLYTHKITLYFFERFDPTNDGLINYLRSQTNSQIDFFDNIKLYDFFSHEYEQYMNLHWNIPYLRFKVLKNSMGKPENLKFVEGNTAFEKWSGLYKSDLKGKKIDRLFPESYKDWMKLYSKIAKTVDCKTSEYHDKHFNLTLKSLAYSTSNGYLIVFLSETEKIRTLRKVVYA